MADYTGTIIELKDKRAAVFTDKCEFKEIKRRSGMFVGQQVSFSRADIFKAGSGYVRYLAVAASIFIVIASYFLYSQLFVPRTVYAYVDIDINPSIELTIDKDERVLAARALNDDAAKLLGNLKLKSLKVDEAVNEIITECRKEGFIKPEGNGTVLVSASESSDKNNSQENEKLDKILNDIDVKIKDVDSQVQTELIKVNPDDRALAAQNNLSMGRYVLYNEIKQDGANITVEQAKNSRVSEMISKAKNKENKNDKSNVEKPRDNELTGDASDNKDKDKTGNDNNSTGDITNKGEDRKDNGKSENDKEKTNGKDSKDKEDRVKPGSSSSNYDRENDQDSKSGNTKIDNKDNNNSGNKKNKK